MSEVKFSTELIGPDRAKALLSNNSKNRNVSRVQVDALSRDMTHGLWQDNGETVKVDTDGTLVDGQHRLLAVIKSGATVRMTIAYNVSMTTQLTVDTGRSRSFADHLKLQGEANTNVLAAMTRDVFIYRSGKGPSGRTNLKPTLTELSAVLATNPGLRDSARVGGQVKKGADFSASALGFCHYVLSEIDPVDAEDFFNKVKSGVGLEENSPIHRLREVSRDYTRNNKAADRWDFAVPVIFKAWNKYRDGSECKSLGFRKGGANPESFPQPH